MKELSTPLESALAEVLALIINLSVIDLELLYQSVSKLRRLLRCHLDTIYSSQIPLIQMINDLCRLLSPSRDNPLHKGDFRKYHTPKYDRYKESSSQIVRILVMNVLNALSEVIIINRIKSAVCIILQASDRSLHQINVQVGRNMAQR